jgi:hypothetical protein
MDDSDDDNDSYNGYSDDSLCGFRLLWDPQDNFNATAYFEGVRQTERDERERFYNNYPSIDEATQIMKSRGITYEQLLTTLLHDTDYGDKLNNELLPVVRHVGGHLNRIIFQNQFAEKRRTATLRAREVEIDVESIYNL